MANLLSTRPWFMLAKTAKMLIQWLWGFVWLMLLHSEHSQFLAQNLTGRSSSLRFATVTSVPRILRGTRTSAFERGIS